MFWQVFIIDFLCGVAKKSITFKREAKTLFSKSKKEFSNDIFSKTDTIDSKQVVSSIALINIIILGIAPTLFNTEVRPGFISKI